MRKITQPLPTTTFRSLLVSMRIRKQKKKGEEEKALYAKVHVARRPHTLVA
jgi:hypothetical protein